MADLQPPEPLTTHHALDGFDCGETSLNDWLQRRALQNQQSGATRTFVSIDTNGKVQAYYALASSAIAPASATGRFRRNMPDPIPVVVLARLAIAKPHQSHGFGRALFQDAGRRVVQAADTIGIRGLLVHALSDEAKAFYLALGLDPSPLEPMTLMVTIADLKAAVDQADRAMAERIAALSRELAADHRAINESTEDPT
jgi:GNAT superfamily N-acetyltransferase